jgi:hypothetical protein
MTTLSKFTDAYATVPVATYQPLVISWVSSVALLQYMRTLRGRDPLPTTKALRAMLGGEGLPTALQYQWSAEQGSVGQVVGGSEAASADRGEARARRSAAAGEGAGAGVHGTARANVFADARGFRRPKHLAELAKVLKSGSSDPAQIFQVIAAGNFASFLTPEVVEVLSPIGIAHFYRQLYFDVAEGVGPIEQAFTVAPNEEVELVYETMRRTVREQVEEFGSESTVEQSEERRTSESLTDTVRSSIARDASVSLSVDVAGDVGVYEAGVSASADLATASENSREQVKTTTRELNTRSAEKIRRTHSVRIKQTDEWSERSSSRRVISNPTADPVNYGLRRVLRRARIKVQDLGPSLVWQSYVRDPGVGLARSRYLRFANAGELLVPDVPAGSPPIPTGGAESISQEVSIRYGWKNPEDTKRYNVVDISVPGRADRTITDVTIESITDPAAGKRSIPPSLEPSIWIRDPTDAPATNGGAVFRIGVDKWTTAMTLRLQIMVHFAPSQAALDAWEAEVADLRTSLERTEREAEFEREKKTLTAISRIQSRPSADLRKEERSELMNRLVSEMFGGGGSSGGPGALEIEQFHVLFDVSSVFYQAHPSWWRPRQADTEFSPSRPPYPISEGSEPAPLGSSLGWQLQLDGDRRRNEFLNSPWARVCIPIKKGMEARALKWLAEHIEGTLGFSTEPGTPLGDLLSEVEERREREKEVPRGPDFVTMDGEAAPGLDDATDLYPVVEEFEVVLPTEGFLYESVDIDV